MKVLLLGIGNILFADEGVGVHFVNYLSENYRFTHPQYSLDILDGGTLAQGLTPIIAKYDHLIVCDTVNAPGVLPGEVYFFDFDAAPAEIDWQGSAHEVEMLQTLTMMEMLGDRPKTFVLGVTPTVLEPMHLGLTEALSDAIPVMEQALLGHLKELGFQSDRIANKPITSFYQDGITREVSVDENH
ncbi:HyaD/HybD family hydrogenase maturation endopeptidase [Shewanella litorisediminis]|uniref:HyaD/HybD family hydrogenase maturation endopeptidase n=1 Tax=Shewanella litorisediminis TaxID=1173586 RepID=A0ABX7G830_9GAMM|nr:HyaD/HybD family hydrogenase maturation endopeptidase [Shewanella litorisediminis]MCL2919128.1 HyaD/HybD family hydrogenase maturation endopeptidase [Shewanella litorisediminis]QRH03378.1 HyaD/HybD family hydrogenase maturation endopeptidase [Shewanella litorisediminis]